jgi:hypothetical protein
MSVEWVYLGPQSGRIVTMAESGTSQQRVVAGAYLESPL